MSNVITVEIKNVYGVERIYPVNAAAQNFAAIAQTKTLSKTDIALIKNLGMVVQVVTPVITL